ncbi:MAG: hypothetical protein AAGI37_02725 [Planctomycetota bacterium]
MTTRTLLASTACTALISASAHAMLIDDYSSTDLSDYTKYVILDVNGGASNDTELQVVNGEVFAVTTSYDDIEQLAFIRNGLSLEVGQEVQASIKNLAVAAAWG